MIFEINELPQKDASQGGDGTVNEQTVPSEVQVYATEVIFGDARPEKLYGEVTLIR